MSSYSLILLESHHFESYSNSCSTQYNVLAENLTYAFQAVYLVPTLFLLIWILVTIRIRHRADYANNIWFWIYSVDCLASILLILLDLFITRLFLYFPQLCHVYSDIFIKYPIINHIYFPLYNYLRAIKPVTQCALILIRLSCVIDIMRYDKKWAKEIPKCITIVCLLPLLVIWNTVISKKEVIFWRGGFFVIYHRYFSWASLSIMHIAFILTAIIVTLVTSILIIRRLHEFDYEQTSHRPICIASAFIASSFFLQAVVQTSYALFRNSWWLPSLVVDFQFVIYDVLTVGTPIIVINTSTHLKDRLMRGPDKEISTKQNFLELQIRKPPVLGRLKPSESVDEGDGKA